MRAVAMAGRVEAPALITLLVIGGWTMQTHCADYFICGGCSFTVSDEGLLQRTGSCSLGAAGANCMLMYAGIVDIEEGTFDGLHDMTYLDLSQNQLTNIPGGLFDGLSGLQYLSLSYNQLSSIAPDAFSNCTQLSYVDVSFNQLTCYYASWPLEIMSLDTIAAGKLCQNMTTNLTGNVTTNLIACYPHISVELDSANLPSDMAGQYCEAFDCKRDEGGSWFGGVDYAHCFRKNDDKTWKIWNTGCGWEIGQYISVNAPSPGISWQRYARTYSGYCHPIPPSQLDIRALVNTSTFYDSLGNMLVGVHSVLVLSPHNSSADAVSAVEDTTDTFNASSAVNSSSADSSPLPLVDTALLSFPECVERRDWGAMLELMNNGTAATGGLGLLMEPPLESWICIQEHPCLQRVADAQPSDMMCFVYHEVDRVFLPWSINSLLKLVMP
ncbi:hypothetical protein GUITHDRAFT_122127 [Guillardia theta CCMP2712]|uniref:Leucine-rich repeat-containing N-terminal plant-type domain-containing protein n=1 Tax=Guillardia theta (strain CCMP2712) TaxID=905079 RepID=L1I6H0_GUITC|nr:hypothetical protein GUITHDRAFT_122127 [Guillardia theta CCMP2712]EKX31687.1 hypothetical protein GUITHDRAFT_122127 [Guillardia theta CCMP2712]|eukprot:XP_005818667.1 hypothetical protein GUITHDRAFT_122127 [Guillardia theta CCMP2712]